VSWCDLDVQCTIVADEKITDEVDCIFTPTITIHLAQIIYH